MQLTECVDKEHQQREGHDPGNVRLHNQEVLLGGEEHRAGAKVVGVLPSVLLRPRGIENQVPRHPPH